MDIRLPSIEGRSTKYDAFVASTTGSTHSQARTASLGGSYGNTRFALPKSFDPANRGMSGFLNDASDYDLTQFDQDEAMRARILQGCRNIAKTHPLVSASIRIMSRYPLQGLDLHHNDNGIEKFFRELFIEDLDFQTVLTNMGENYWTDGMACLYGNWNDDLGLFVGEELLDPIDVIIDKIPFSGEELYYLQANETLKNFMNFDTDARRIFQLRNPELYAALSGGHLATLDSSRVCVLSNKERATDIYGTPVLMRAWSTLALEDRMHAAMKAVADRLYAPLTMFQIGGTLPDGTAFIPPPEALDAFRNNLDLALSSDFRAIVTHSGVEAKEVIRGTGLNAFKADMDMFDERILMAFGLSTSMFKPSTQNYATSALDFQLVAQLLSTYQRMLMRVFYKQAAVVAEAQEIFEYEKKGDDRIPIMERREVWNPEINDGAGGYEVKEVPKVAIPEMRANVVDFKDEQTERSFRLMLKESIGDISDSDISVGVDIDLEASAEKYNLEYVNKKVNEARRMQNVFNACIKQGLPVPPEVKLWMDQAIPAHEQAELVLKWKGENSPLDSEFFDDESTQEVPSTEYGDTPPSSHEMDKDAPKAASAPTETIYSIPLSTRTGNMVGPR